jgi:cytochrome c-type biogenesis protein CcsB
MRAVRAISNLFSSVKFGIALLVALFLYMAVGSAGIVYPVHPNLLHPDAWRHAMPRQWRPFEMTEFEWFRWWPFLLLMALIATNIAWTTLRRIPLRPVNFGVWMIHLGVLTVIAGSVWYFATKVEGDAPVSRRDVRVAIAMRAGAGAGRGEGSLLASPGNQTRIQVGDEPWTVQVASIDPAWKLQTAGSAGESAYSIMLAVEGPGRKFIRQVIVGHPELTEDLLLTGDPQQPVQRAVTATGRAIVEPRLTVTCDFAPQRWFYLKNDLVKSWALYVRRPGELKWTQRPIDGLPMYNDRFGDRSWVDGDDNEPVDPVDVPIPAVSAGDPFPDVVFHADGFLRYAVERTRLRRGDADSPLNPAMRVRIEGTAGGVRDFTLAALDPRGRTSDGDLIRFRLARSEQELAARSRDAHLRFALGGAGVIEVPLNAAPAADGFIPFGPEGGGYAVKIVAVQDDLVLSGGEVSVVIADLRTPHGSFRRWIFDDPALNRDMEPGEKPDPRAPAVNQAPELESRYEPGVGRVPITLIAGPDPARLTAVLALTDAVEARPVQIGEPLQISAGTALRVMEYHPRAVKESRPLSVPREQRAKDAGERLSMARIAAPGGEARWLRYHDYVFDRAEDVLRRQTFQPRRLRLADGREAEVLFSRRRVELPSPIALESFALTAQVGGFTGETSTIRDYTSQIRFGKVDGTWSEPRAVSVNEPVESNGLWFFQAQWDPPDAGDEAAAASAGLNFTVLGVGTRQGVWLQLAGAVLAALGMAYAFYVKPVIKRRAMESALASAQARLHPSRGGAATVALLLALGMASSVARAAAQDAASPQGSAPGVALEGVAAAPSAAVVNDFAHEVDLAPLEGSAVMSEGRIKSLGSFAFGWMQEVSGGRRVQGQTPLFTVLDMAIRPEAYRDADVIRVKNAEVRAQLARAIAAADASQAARMRGFQSHGMIARSLLWSDETQTWRDEIAPSMRQLSGDLIRSAKQIDQLRAALAMMEAATIRSRLRAVPVPAAPGQDAASLPWKPLDQADGAVAASWRRLQEAWVAGDAPAASAASRELAAALAAVNPAAYPSADRLSWESWYFRTGQMTWVWFVFFAAIALLLLGVTWRWPWARRAGLLVFGAAFLLQTAAVALRWYISGRWPNANMFESVTTSAWFGSCLACAAEVLFRRTAARGLFALGAAVASMAALMACALLPAQLNPAIGNMMPVLHDVWLYIHTNVVIFSYALIFMAAVSAALYLAWRWRGGPPAFARTGGAGEMMALTHEGAAAESAPTARLGEILDGVTMTLMELSFVLLWSGIAMGAIWADHSWGRPWGWDPKEVFALNTFIVFAVLIHTRWRCRDKGLWTAVLALVGAGVMLFNWIVINFVITGLHSYA